VTDDHHVLDAVRDAADPRLEAGAAARISQGAWERAAASRGGSSRFLAGPRVAWAAAAAVLVAVSLLALHGTEPAFAVEGDPVMVARGGEWRVTRNVDLDDVVRVPEHGTCILRSRDIGVLSPLPGSEFRFVRLEGAPHDFRIEFERGGGEFDGASFVVAARDVVVQREPSAVELCFTIALTEDAGDASVSVERGAALVRSIATSERLLLQPAERAETIRVRLEGQACRRIAKVSDWTRAADKQIASGRIAFVDADFRGLGGITLFGTTDRRELVGFEVPLSEVRDAVRSVNAVAAIRFAVGHAVQPAAVHSICTYELGSRRVEAVKRTDGSVTVSEQGATRVFADVASFRRDAPDVAALFAGALY
jgi:hypothetical protein